LAYDGAVEEQSSSGSDEAADATIQEVNERVNPTKPRQGRSALQDENDYNVQGRSNTAKSMFESLAAGKNSEVPANMAKCMTSMEAWAGESG